jgi:cleavage and polyadenylation specificity factor subunit 4
LEFPSVKVNQIEIDNNVPADDLDDMQNAEMIKDIGLDLKENDEDEDGASSECSEDGNEDANEEYYSKSEDAAAL